MVKLFKLYCISIQNIEKNLLFQTNSFSISLRCPDANYIARAVRIEVPENKGPQKVGNSQFIKI